MDASYLDRFLAENALPPGLDLEAIRRQWLALRPPYTIAERHLPLPVWARRPLTDPGHQAWQILAREVPALDATRPFCIYVHVPFCAGRCAFCDCYSFRLASHREEHVTAYVDLLAREMAAWSGLGGLAGRPVSTVHLGGGTPTYLGPGALGRLVGLLRQHLAPDAGTEWAIESTASELSPRMLAELDNLGFQRLHVGVQSLQDPVRRAIDRRAPAAAVLDVLAAALARGWVVSVDLIYGLPGQTAAGLLADIHTLAAAGIDGLSLYELQVSGHNRRFARQHGLDRRDRRHNYLLGQIASQALNSLGYEKKLFNHFARGRDTNLYFTFPERGDDLLALGTIADGVFGDYHYRHPTYASYGRNVRDGFAGLQGGLRRTALENRLLPLVTALMAGRVPPALLQAGAGQALAGLWQQALLLQPGPQGGELALTGSGSWFVGNMIDQLLAAGEGSQAGTRRSRGMEGEGRE